MNRPRTKRGLIAAIPVVFAFAAAFAAAASLALAAASSAFADSSTSSNWSGYAVHRAGLSFRQVAATWREPSADCRPGSPSFSAIWVGLGGFSLSSSALEQIGTEVDCSRSGSVVSTAWYELVPAASAPIHLRPRPSDTMQALVSVTGRRVTLMLRDRTRHKSFTKTVSASHLDVSSAEWIVEAPSECTSNIDCQTLPLADFDSVRFSNADAVTSAGSTGSISSHQWRATRITLAFDGPRYVSAGAPAPAAAAPSPLHDSGSAFAVSFSQAGSDAIQSAFSQSRTAVAAVAGAAVVAPADARRPSGALRRRGSRARAHS